MKCIQLPKSKQNQLEKGITIYIHNILVFVKYRNIFHEKHPNLRPHWLGGRRKVSLETLIWNPLLLFQHQP